MVSINNKELTTAIGAFEDMLATASLDDLETTYEAILERFDDYEDVLEPWFEFRVEAEAARRERLEEAAGLETDLREALAEHYEELGELREELAEASAEGERTEFTTADLDVSQAHLDYLADRLDSAVAAETLSEDSPVVGMIDDDFDFDFNEGSSGVDRLKGSSADDFMLGHGGADKLRGGKGADKLDGGRGRDVLDGGAGADGLFGGGGRDKLKGRGGQDVLDGGRGKDVLVGGGGDDALIGGHGRDKLLGGPGSDVLSGGDHGDTFIFKRGWVGETTITDFDASEGDRLKLKGVRIEDVDMVDGTVLVDLSNGSTITMSGSDFGDLIF